MPVTEPWPDLARPGWEATRDALQRWMQIVGKTRLALAPAQNHYWHVAFHPTARGFTTTPMPYDDRAFEAAFDLLGHRLELRTSEGDETILDLGPGSTSAFWHAYHDALDELDIEVVISPVPQEMEDTTPFDIDTRARPYDAAWVEAFFTALTSTCRVLDEFRSGYVGKQSPIQLFWGALDLSYDRYSGRPAPRHPGGLPHIADSVVRETYSHECSAAGFWPGSGPIHEAAFYAYAYPEPHGYRDAPVLPDRAFYAPEMGEFLLPYTAVRHSDEPERELLAFFRSTYAAAATLGNWDRDALESHRPISPAVSHTHVLH